MLGLGWVWGYGGQNAMGCVSKRITELWALCPRWPQFLTLFTQTTVRYLAASTPESSPNLRLETFSFSNLHNRLLLYRDWRNCHRPKPSPTPKNKIRASKQFLPDSPRTQDMQWEFMLSDPFCQVQNYLKIISKNDDQMVDHDDYANCCEIGALPWTGPNLQSRQSCITPL